MLAYLLIFGLVGFIAGRGEQGLGGLAVVVGLAIFLGIHWLPLDLVEYGIGWYIGREVKKHEDSKLDQ